MLPGSPADENLQPHHTDRTHRRAIDAPRFRSGLLPRFQISHVVFDFDGTLSWLRHGWPEIMANLFREHLPPLPGETETALREQLAHEILALNGKPSIFQMRRCAELARERHAPVPDPDRLLREYQRRLDTAIAERTREIGAEPARREDYIVYRARPLLERLCSAGLRLIILSGTVQERVREEARLLALDSYFGPHIYGGTADLAQSDKRVVLERLLREESLSGGNLLSFGDGPVELRLTKELGGLAAGIASDEHHNGSGRMHPQKLPQLLEAGADLVLPDYRAPESWLPRLLGPGRG